MNELSEITAPELIPIITALYDCLFDKNKRFTSLQGFEAVVDSGIVKFKGVEDSRKLNFKYKQVRKELNKYHTRRAIGETFLDFFFFFFNVLFKFIFGKLVPSIF